MRIFSLIFVVTSFHRKNFQKKSLITWRRKKLGRYRIFSWNFLKFDNWKYTFPYSEIFIKIINHILHKIDIFFKKVNKNVLVAFFFL